MLYKGSGKRGCCKQYSGKCDRFGMIDTEMNAEFDEEDLALIKEEIPADYIASPKRSGTDGLSCSNIPCLYDRTGYYILWGDGIKI